MVLKFDGFKVNTDQAFFGKLKLSPLAASVSGVAKLKQDEKVRINFENFVFNSFGLGVKSEDLYIQDFVVNGDFLPEVEVGSNVDLKIRSKKTYLDVEGLISKNNISLKSKQSMVSLNEFKHFWCGCFRGK